MSERTPTKHIQVLVGKSIALLVHIKHYLSMRHVILSKKWKLISVEYQNSEYFCMMRKNVRIRGWIVICLFKSCQVSTPIYLPRSGLDDFPRECTLPASLVKLLGDKTGWTMETCMCIQEDKGEEIQSAMLNLSEGKRITALLTEKIISNCRCR